jgi:hypothetical protein
MSIRAIAHPALPRRRRSRSPATRGRYPSAWLANNKALRLRSKGQVCHVEATEVADNQLRDFLGGRLALLWWRTMGASHAMARKRSSPVDSCNGTTLPNPTRAVHC